MADYQGYGDWKGWTSGGFMQFDPIEARYFGAELAGVPLDGARLLEIGFGNGKFLGWARGQGAKLHGTELLPDAVDMARAEGVEILPVDLASVAADNVGHFDIIVAFDVLEHLSPDQIRAMLEAIAILLKPGGRFLARFPNGQSPFSRVYQHGDLTHVTTLSVAVVPQLIAGLPLRMIYGRDARTVYRGGPALRAIKRIKSAARAAVERTVKFLYDFEAPMAVNVVVAIERTASA